MIIGVDSAKQYQVASTSKIYMANKKFDWMYDRYVYICDMHAQHKFLFFVLVATHIPVVSDLLCTTGGIIKSNDEHILAHIPWVGNTHFYEKQFFQKNMVI